jgi:hypothetical protein
MVDTTSTTVRKIPDTRSQSEPVKIEVTIAVNAGMSMSQTKNFSTAL